jgi:hypothetical protein
LDASSHYPLNIFIEKKMCEGGVEETEEGDEAEEEVASCMTHASISLWRTAT